MFAKKVLISLMLVAAIPMVLSRHVSRFHGSVFPDDSVERFPPNIEDLKTYGNELSPDTEDQPNAENFDTPKKNVVVPDFEITGNEIDEQNYNSELHDFGNYLNKVNAVNEYQDTDNVDPSENEVNIDTSDEEVVVPKNIMKPVKMTSQKRIPVEINLENFDDQEQDIPVEIENERPEVQTFDIEDDDEVPAILHDADKTESKVVPDRWWM